MESLQEFLLESKETDIYAIAHYIENHIALNWQILLQKHHEKLLRAFNQAGDMAYGVYLNFLFRPIHQQLKLVGLRPQPRFPGDFSISREWGNPEQTEQQRWMWSAIGSTEGLFGTIVTIVFHDHTQFRIPQKPQIIALTQTTQEDVEAALSHCCAEFKSAIAFNVWYAEYLQSLENPS